MCHYCHSTRLLCLICKACKNRVFYFVLSMLRFIFVLRFTPEVLGIQASSALAWTVFEIIVELITLYVTNIQTNLKTLDLLAYGGYKYVG